MYAGQKASYNGYQYCLFPMDYMDCNQVSGPSSPTHCCGHPCDWGGPYDEYPYYAPCDCTRIWTYPSSGESIWTSDNPVWTPSGLTYVSFMFVHDNNMTSLTHMNQGDLIGHTGIMGYAWGDHLHLDQSLIRNDVITDYGYQCSAGAGNCYALGQSTYPYNVFYLGGTEQIIDMMGMTFQTIPSSPEPPGPEPPGPITPTGELKAAVLLLLWKMKRGNKSYGRKRIRL